ncbi:MAG: FCD domain-containing protein, partial [Eubacterium sp.]|nr:FCD domain-containing protein [Eubacterium sp.]
LYEASRRFEKQAESDEDIMKLAAADEAFHAIIYKASGNQRLEQLINNLLDQMFRYRIEYLKDEANRQSLITEHDELWNSLKNRDYNRSRKFMRQHIERQMESIMQMIQA